MRFEDLVLEGDHQQAWQEIKTLTGQGIVGVRKSLFRISYVVCRHYWWLTGEWEKRSGYLGWSPGDRDWEDQLVYPDPLPDAYLKLRHFVMDLCQITPSSAVDRLIQSAECGSKSSEASYLRYILNTSVRLGRSFGSSLYDYVADNMSCYETMAARPPFFLLFTKSAWKVANATLLLIASRGLEEMQVQSSLVKLRLLKRELPKKSFLYSCDDCAPLAPIECIV